MALSRIMLPVSRAAAKVPVRLMSGLCAQRRVRQIGLAIVEQGDRKVDPEGAASDEGNATIGHNGLPSIQSSVFQGLGIFIESRQ